MTLQEFIAKYNGVGGVGNTPENKGECVGLVMVWLKDQGLPHIWGHGFSLLTNADPEAYEVIKNTPDGVPQPGDVIVWTKGFNGTYGHTAIVVKATVNTFEVFEQNVPLGSPCRLHTYKNYAYVDGWLRPIASNCVQSEPIAQLTDQTIIPGSLLKGQDLEIQALRGLLGDLERVDNRVIDLEAEISKLQLDNKGLMAQAKDLARQLHDSREAYTILLDDYNALELQLTSSPEAPKTDDQPHTCIPALHIAFEKLIAWLRAIFKL